MVVVSLHRKTNNNIKKHLVMKKYILLMLLLVISVITVSAQSNNYSYGNERYYTQTNKASITFSNTSSSTLVLKIIKSYGGLYSTVVLQPNSSRVVTFGSTSSYKLKIKATHNNSVSYHDGGGFSVTCTSTEWTEGTISFSISSYGSGLGPSISAKEFESNY